MRGTVSGIMVVLIAVGALAVVPVGAIAASGAAVIVAGSLTHVPTTGVVDGGDRVLLTAARNEFESTQLLVHGGDAGLTRVAVELSGPLVSDEGSIGLDEVVVYRAVGYTVAGVPSDSEGALGGWFDALVPQRDMFDGQLRRAFTNADYRYDLAANENAVAWIDVHVPPEANAGRYTSTVVVTADNFRAEVPITVDVVDLLLPSVPSHTTAVGFNFNALCPAHYDGGGCPAGKDHWELARRYGMAAVDNRVSLDSIAPGVPSTDGARQLFRSHLLPLYQGVDDTRLPGAKPGILHLYPWIFDACTGDCVAAWRDEATRGGFAEIVRYYDCDEAGASTARWDACKARIDRIRSEWPGIQVQVTSAINDAASIGRDDVPDTFIPLVNFLDGKEGSFARHVGDHRGDYDDWLAADQDRELWTYQACFSHGCENDPQPRPPEGRELCTYYDTPQPYWVGWPSLVIDTPPSQQRAMGWIGYRYDLSGDYYYESTKSFYADTDPGPDRIDAWENQYCYGGHGDGTLWYPGTPARVGGTTQIPVESIRLKRMRDGVEDNELLRLAAAEGNADQALAVARRLVPRAYQTTFGQGALDAARLELFQLAGASLPVSSSLRLPRLAGDDRYATAAAVATASWDNADTVILSRGDLFPDSLAASFLAGALDTPILLSTTTMLPAATMAALRTLGTSSVVLVGGPAALSPDVEAALREAGLTTRRIAGEDRYATALRVAVDAGADAVSMTDGRRTAIVSSGANFPDALSAAPLSFALGMPLLLTPPGGLPPGLLDTLEALGITDVVVTGGEVAVDDAVVVALRQAGYVVTRVAGDDRYATSVAVAAAGLAAGLSPAHVDVARGDLFADALVGGAHTGRVRGTTLLTPPDRVVDVVCAHLADQADQIVDGHVLGGPLAVADGVVLALERCADRGETATDPEGPTAVTATGAAADMIELTWTPASGIDAQLLSRLAHTGTCPLDETLYSVVTELPATSGAYSDVDLAPKTRYCYLVQSTDDGRRSPPTAESIAAASTTELRAPTSTALDFRLDTDDVLGAGDRIVVTFDVAPRAPAGTTLTFGDHEGDEARLTCGSDATCTVNGEALVVNLTAAPAPTANRGNGAVDTDVYVVVLDSSVDNDGGAWNLARSGLPAFERVFGTANPTNSALAAAVAAGDVSADAGADTVTVNDADCTPFPDYGTVLLHAADGALLAVDSDGDDPTCDVTLSATIASGDQILVVYRVPGPYTISRTRAVAVP